MTQQPSTEVPTSPDLAADLRVVLGLLIRRLEEQRSIGDFFRFRTGR